MFKVIFYTTFLCKFALSQNPIQNMNREELFYNIRDLAEQYIQIFVPYSYMCKEGDLQVNLHRIDRNGRIISTVRAHENKTVKPISVPAKMVMLIPGYNDNPTGHAVRTAASALKQSIDNVAVYLVDSKQVRPKIAQKKY